MHLRLKEERLRRGLSLTKLSALSGGISAADLSRLERGLEHPWPSWRSRLSRVFRIPQADLFAPAAPVSDNTNSPTAAA